MSNNGTDEAVGMQSWRLWHVSRVMLIKRGVVNGISFSLLNE